MNWMRVGQTKRRIWIKMKSLERKGIEDFVECNLHCAFRRYDSLLILFSFLPLNDGNILIFDAPIIQRIII